MLRTRPMSVKQLNQTESQCFGEASEKLLLNIAMESSLEELNQMVEPRRKPVNLHSYYRSLQTWRSPLLHKVDV